MTNNNTKRALLGSALALILCFAMLMGTTFAWFTDSASTQVSTVKSGTLDVELQVMEDNGWVSAEGKTLNFRAADGREEILWEPGATYELPELRIVNKGNLALKYKIEVSGIGGDAELNNAIEWEIKGVGINGISDWTKLSEANLADIALSVNQPVESPSTTPTADGHTFIIRGHMKEEAGNEYQNKTLEGAAITVYAAQYTEESDSYDNQYDKDAEYAATVANLDDLRTAVANGGSIILTEDVKVENDEMVEVEKSNGNKEPAMMIIDKDTTIDLKGKKFIYEAGGTCYFAFYVRNGATLNIIDSSGDNSGLVQANDPEGTWLVNVCGGATANIYGGHFVTMDGCAIYKNDGYINIYGGKFETGKNSHLLLNLGDPYISYGPIMVYGGSFKNFEPGVTNGSESKVADGYKVTQDGDWYNVVAK